ncbi:DUF6371 domain-containing protein [Gabonibacter massiliensis]|uniref:DUF6371 domain-containing protein n=1 Tax=Gabonibacter massiliensis TaxID=1720195 RepID=UPI000A6C19EA|nr:DUF6371 domain-containing protein [Gabonibacter massiliensis]
MKTYRYRLQPYGGMASRFTCPACGATRKFVRYIDTVTGQFVNEKVGRCERSESCGYHYTPREYFRDLRRLGIDPPSSPGQSAPVIKSDTFSIIPPELLGGSALASQPEQTALLKFLVSHLHLTPAQLKRLVDTYRLQSASYGRIVFPQIDVSGNYRTAKIMAYNPANGHRIKDRPGSFNWLHRTLVSQGKLPTDFQLRQCLFGEHLLPSHPLKPVGIVESEKTALVCALTYPKLLWLATGGKYNFTPDRFIPLAGRIINAIPDAGSYRFWAVKAKAITRLVRCQLYVSDCVERVATPEQHQAGIDIADLVLAGHPPQFF